MWRRLFTTGVSKRVRIVEVGPRDGLQNEPSTVSPLVKIEFIRRLIDAGLKTVEVGSFVSPKWVPQMASTAEVIKGLEECNLPKDVRLPALVPNIKGFENALALNSPLLNEISVFTAASNGFTRKNINMTIEESLRKIEEVTKRAKELNIPVRGYISTVIACPYDGPTDPQAVLDVSKELLRLGCYEISLGDTIGIGAPGTVKPLLDKICSSVLTDNLAVHFHDTYGQALANIYIALDYEVRVIDSAAAGLGGCPYAPGASGNVATEDVLYMLNSLGYESGVDFDKVAEAGKYIIDKLGRPNRSNAGSAWLAKTNK